MLQMETRCDQARGDLQQEVKIKIDALYPRRDLQAERQPGIFYPSTRRSSSTELHG